ncbi:MAG: BrnA antitoxin family protein [Actinomycetota bacterium]|nr:BrnA antitoxin family protein [Actinomycetota bacterium]
MDADEQLAALRDFYDNNDQSAELETAELDTSMVEDPMVGITVRLPAFILNAARALAAERGVKVTALLREYVEQQLADQVADDRVVPVAELRRLIAHAG